MTNAEKEIVNALPETVQELATDMIESCKSKDAKKYATAANTFDIIYNRKQFDCSVMQSFARFILPKALEAGIIQQPAPQKPVTENPNMVSEKVVGKTEVKADTKTAKKK